MQRRRALLVSGISLAVLTVVAIVYGFVLSWQATREFDLRGWDVPARVFAAPFELYPGRQIAAAELRVELERLGYAADSRLRLQGSYEVTGSSVRLRTRTFSDARGTHPSQQYTIGFNGAEIRSIRDGTSESVVIAELDPMPIGSLFPSHGEDRIVLAPEEVPPLLIEGLKAVEDRRFEDHFGIDVRGIARAAWANVRARSLEQGASTLTQQLIRSYFLNQEKTFTRKIREAFMAIALEAQKGKDEIALAYVNEVYLGQDGARAIHGFGLAAQYYFGKPLTDLELHEIALLIGQVRGPSWYDPRRHPERARDRRDQVLAQMLERELISESELDTARARSLGVTTRRASGYFAAFLDLVRRQLRADYAAPDLESQGLNVFTTLDPSVQAAAERALSSEIDALQSGRAALETALVVTTPHDAEVKALVGGRQPGFNRALDARRPIGSLIKPAVYLAALESRRVSMATTISDAPIEIRLADGRLWSPQNFDDEFHGELTVARALTDSVNTATVRLGMQIGVARTVDVLQRLGMSRAPAPYPSLLLGAIELTPLEVAAIYNTIANGGFRQPLRSVRAVIAADGSVLQRSHIGLERAADPADVYKLNAALVEVMRSGTGKTAARRLPPSLITAGKTGTSDDFRDSWFA
ncbi:MAG TPA: transglycosylase domain-containing protein, partial [Gammaproteobacteria bacterium]|nr:transglycosylase domain-containing protein [Gammaproteobacteria bacterium]